MKDQLTDRNQQYQAAPRAINDPSFPTQGYYFIRAVREKTDENGNIYPYAVVNWKLNEDDTWGNYKLNKFKLRLDYLFGDCSLKPNITPQELRHRLIQVKSIVVDKKAGHPLTPSRVFADWEITEFVDLFDAMPYFSLFDPYVFAEEDYQYELYELEQLAIAYDEREEDVYADEDVEYEGDAYADEDVEYEEDDLNNDVQPKTTK